MTQDRHTGCFELSPELLKQALHLPKSSQIYGVKWNFDRDNITVYVIDPSFTPTPKGRPCQTRQLLITTHTEIVKNQKGQEVALKTYESEWS